VNIFVVADSPKHFLLAIAEYEKRLGKRCALVYLPPEKYGDTKKIIDKETSRIIEALKKKPGYTILLDVIGKEKDTMMLSTQLEKLEQEHKNINWVIGGAFGVNRDAI